MTAVLIGLAWLAVGFVVGPVLGQIARARDEQVPR